MGDVCDFTCVGEPVTVAARLQALARPGEIVVGPTAWRQATELVETEGIPYQTETAELKGCGNDDDPAASSPPRSPVCLAEPAAAGDTV